MDKLFLPLAGIGVGIISLVYLVYYLQPPSDVIGSELPGYRTPERRRMMIDYEWKAKSREPERFYANSTEEEVPEIRTTSETTGR